MNIRDAIAFALHGSEDARGVDGLNQCPDRDRHYHKTDTILADPAVKDALDEHPSPILIRALTLIKDLVGAADGKHPYTPDEVIRMGLAVLNEAYDLGIDLPGEEARDG